MRSIRRFFDNQAIPQEYRGNFIHLYFDIAWFGILSGSAINFLNVYAARLGANGFQIGLLAAVGAIVNLIFAIPTGNWLGNRPVGKSVFWTSVLYRLGYLLWIPLPWLFGNQGQIWALVSILLLMGIPLTVLSVGFNALFASAVPSEWRAYVAGIRNVVLSVTFILSSLGSGWLLDHLRFPVGYQVVFGIGALGALMSSLHLYFIRSYPAPGPPVGLFQPEPVLTPRKPSSRRNRLSAIRLDIWRTRFGGILLVMLGLHLAQYLPVALFPLYFVNTLHLTDSEIGIGTALFYLTVLIGSTQLNRIVHKLNHHKVTAFGLMGMSLYPIMLSFSHQVAGFYLTSAIGGFTWALVGGAYANYLLENIPEHDRPSHLAWYTLVLNICVLMGSLVGPLLARYTGLGIALMTFGGLRFLAGVAFLKWGAGELESTIHS